MASLTQDLVYGIPDQLIYYDAPEGRPQSVVSVFVWASSATERTDPELAIGTPEVEEDPDTTFDAASGVSQPDPRRCNLASTAGIAIGRTYLATNAEGEQEHVRVTSVSSDLYVMSRSALHNDYASGALFQSTRIQVPVEQSWLDDPVRLSWEIDPNPRYRVRWHYIAANGSHAIVDSYFDVLEYAARYSVTGADVEDLQPGWLDRLPRDDREQQGRSAIAAAYNAVKWELYTDLVPDQAIRNRELFEQLIAARAAADLVATTPNLERYAKLYNQLIRSGVAQVSAGGEAPPVVVESRPVWRR